MVLALAHTQSKRRWKMSDFEDLDGDELDYWLEMATEYLVAHNFLPLSDEVWETDKYLDQIIAKAQELFDESAL